jgi:hypothetical protein
MRKELEIRKKLEIRKNWKQQLRSLRDLVFSTFS